MTPEEIKEYLQPDKTKLDEEWEIQPGLFFEATKEYAGWKSRSFELSEKLRQEKITFKTELERMKSELALDVRTNQDKYNLGNKITDKSIEAFVSQNDDINDFIQKKMRVQKVLSQKLSEAIKNEELWDGIKSALLQRRDAIKDLSDLWRQEYFQITKKNKFKGKRKSG